MQPQPDLLHEIAPGRARRLPHGLNPARSLGARLGLAFVLLALALALGFSLVLESGAVAQAREARGRALAELADQVGQRLERDLRERLRDLELQATLETSAADREPAAARRRLEALKASHPAFLWVGIVGPDGRVTAGTGGLLEGAGVSGRPAFEAGRRAPYVGGVRDASLLAAELAGPDGRVPRLLDLAVPLAAPAGSAAGALVAHLDWRWTDSVRESLGGQSETELVIAGPDGVVLLGPPALGGQRLDQRALALAGERGHRLGRWPDGLEALAGFRRSSASRGMPDPGWTVLVRQDASIAMAGVSDLRRGLLLAGAGLGLLFASLGWVVARRVTRPLIQMARVAHRLRHGEPAELPLMAGRDEVGLLSRALRGLVGTLAERDRLLSAANETLEARVEQRTRALALANAELEARNQDALLLAGMAARLGEPGDARQLARQALAEALPALGLVAADLVERRGDLAFGGTVASRTVVGRDAAELELALAGPARLDEAGLGSLARSGAEPAYLPDLARAGGSARLVAAGAGALAVLPLVPDGSLALRLVASAPREWDERDRRRLEGTARVVALALERERSSGEVAGQARALDAFARFAEAAGTELGVDELGRRALAVIRATIGEGSAAHYVQDGGRWRAISWHGDLDEATVRELRAGFSEAEPAFLLASTTQQPAFFDGSDGERRRVGSAPAEGAYLASALYPVMARGRLHSIFGVGLRSTAAWAERDRAVVRAVGRSLTLAVERAEVAAASAAQKADLEARTAEQETFVYTVSHDLRSPLLAIQGMAGLLGEAVRDGDSAAARHALERIGLNVEKMGQLLNDLLALSRVGRAAEDPEDLELAEIVASVVAELEDRLAARGTHLSLPDAWPRLHLPRAAAYQIVANLLGNAAKFAGRGAQGPRVRLSWSVAAGRVCLRVDDDGPGVAPEQRERVWELFRKLDPAAEGTGVGLAIVKRAVELHGGRAWVETSDLGGASFAVTLPAAAVPAPAAAGSS